MGRIIFIKLEIMTSKKQKKLNIELAKNIVRFESYYDTEFQTCCAVSIGGIIAVEKYALKGMEEEVLEDMKLRYFGIDKSIGVN